MGIKRRLEARDWLNIIAILLLIGLSIVIARAYGRVFGGVQEGGLLAQAENLRLFILSYGRWGLLIITALHWLQVVVAIIPSVMVQFVGGLIYGMGLGMLTGLVGINLGTAVSFYLSRLLGRRVVTLFVSDKDLHKLDGLITSDTGTLLLLLLFILPTPKDFIAYFAGLTDMRASRFLLISAVGRLPGMFVATYLGSHLLTRNYLLLGLVVVLCCAVGLLSFIFRDRIWKLMIKNAEQGRGQ